MIKLLIAKHWKAVLCVVLVGIVSVVVNSYAKKNHELHDQITELNKSYSAEVSALKQMLTNCQTSKDQYKEVLEHLDELRESVEVQVDKSQLSINELQKSREQILSEMSKMDISKLTCAQKFDWMKQQALEEKNK